MNTDKSSFSNLVGKTKDAGKAIGIVILVLILLGTIFIYNYQGILIGEDVAIKALNNAGYSDVKIIGKDIAFIGMKGGGKGDDARFTANAKNPAGKEVKVYVFAGWPFKGATIRN